MSNFKYNFEDKWGEHLKNDGWTIIPNALIQMQQKLGINSSQLNILLILISYWWNKDQMPFPSKNTIAKTIGCTTSSVRKNIKTLEDLGYINRIYNKNDDNSNSSNIYDISNLKNILEEEVIKKNLIIRNSQL